MGPGLRRDDSENVAQAVPPRPAIARIHARCKTPGKTLGEAQMSEAEAVLIERDGPITIISINRPHCRNAVDGATARRLYDAFLAFDADEAASVAVFTGTGGHFCAGADLKAVAKGDREKMREIDGHGSIAPMGPSRLRLSKPVIAAVEGYAVAGGMELALFADMRVVAEDATFGIFCRRFGVPLIDLGTIRLPRMIGHSHAMDLILTGRAVGGEEALRIGLANRLVPTGEARAHAIQLAREMARFPQTCLRADRLSALKQWDIDEDEAIRNEMRGGLDVIASGETLSGATRFASGVGRHGAFGAEAAGKGD
jgi:enoyl-CoA hydratase